jgi:ATP-binding cassette subfamily C protein CydCD
MSIGTIRFTGVTCVYAGRGEGLVQPVDLSIAPRTTTLIVGPSGAGKSTLLSLLVPFIRPSTGSITVSGVDLGGLDLDAWRKQLGWVAQPPSLFSGTVLDNIRLAAPRATEAEAESLLASLFPDGRISLSKRLSPNGEGLSGGERVRVALARALARRPALLLLDEPTAFLDPVARDAVLAAVRHAGDSAALVIATHEPELFAWAERVVALPGAAGSPVTKRAAVTSPLLEIPS